MAWETVKCSCGHYEKIELLGKNAERERKIQYFEESGLCKDCYKKLMSSKNNSEGEIIAPKNQISEIIVNIKIDDNFAIAQSEKDENLRLLYKKYGYHWNFYDHRWEYECKKEWDGCSEDRAAELGNAILLAGYPIKISDKSLKDIIINADFVPRSLRWIVSTKGEHDDMAKFLIKIEYNNNELYQAARALPCSKWNSSGHGFSVAYQYFQEVTDFADLYGYKLSKGALELKKEAEQLINNASRVNVKTVQTKLNQGLKGILQESAEVIEDLKDD